MAPSRSKRSVPPAPPREPLTKKARAAILKYVAIRANPPVMLLACEMTLKAERMPRKALYQWLEAKGYRWKASLGYWAQKQK